MHSPSLSSYRIESERPNITLNTFKFQNITNKQQNNTSENSKHGTPNAVLYIRYTTIAKLEIASRLAPVVAATGVFFAFFLSFIAFTPFPVYEKTFVLVMRDIKPEKLQGLQYVIIGFLLALAGILLLFFELTIIAKVVIYIGFAISFLGFLIHLYIFFKNE